MSCWVRHCIPQHIMCADNASDSEFNAIIFNAPLKAALTSKRRKFILWRIPIWLWTDHWPRFNELLQIDHRMTWNRTPGRIVSKCATLNKQACCIYVHRNAHTKVHPAAVQHVTWPLPLRHMHRWQIAQRLHMDLESNGVTACKHHVYPPYNLARPFLF